MALNPAHDFSPDFPRDWEERKRCVHERDRNHCQITGCLHTTGLGVHHIIPIHIRPDHRLENLVLLCRFHHALLPTHERLPNEDNPRYRLVRSSWRWNDDKTKRIEVKASVQRKAKARVTEAAMAQLFLDLDARYAIECRHCRARDWKIRVESALGRLAVTCMKCWRAWLFDRGLPEEIGVQLFHTALTATQNRGGFELLPDRLCVRPPIEAYVCECCRDSGHFSILEKRVTARTGGAFLGCEKWRPQDGCRKRERGAPATRSTCGRKARAPGAGGRFSRAIATRGFRGRRLAVCGSRRCPSAGAVRSTAFQKAGTLCADPRSEIAGLGETVSRIRPSHGD